ncbi:hypothetical protein PINS_up023579 [Pythium insidiosum]|nr:hypothetical protein PINS_up023579 [Pythium insidiosum]
MTAADSELENRDEHRTGSLPLGDVREVMLTMDPLADPNAVMAALMRGVGVKSRAQLRLHDVVEYKAVIKVRKQACAG